MIDACSVLFWTKVTSTMTGIPRQDTSRTPKNQPLLSNIKEAGSEY